MKANKRVVGPLLGFLTLIFSFIAIAGGLLQARLVFWICLLLALVSLAIFARLRFADFMNFFISRQARYGANVALSIVGVIGIAVFVNVIVVQRFDKQVDLTKLQLYTLSEQTKTVLKDLKQEIRVIAFFIDDTSRAAVHAKDMLESYQRETNLLTFSFKNPNFDVQLTDKYEVRRDGTLIFESADRYEKVTTVEEQKFTSALLKLIRDETKKIYFLVGHKEPDIGDLNPDGYSEVRTELENQNYAAFTLSLLTEPDIPADCALLVLAGPKSPLTSHEIDIVAKYLQRSGKLLLMLDPSPSAKDVHSGIVRLMRRWGIAIGNDLVIDEIQFGVLFGGPTAPIPGMELHEITRAMRDPVVFLETRSVTPMADRAAHLNVKSLAKTVGEIDGSWGEKQRSPDGTFSRPFTYKPGVDTPPPVSIAVAAEQKLEEKSDGTAARGPTRIVVFGDSDFAVNAAFRAANRDLFLAAIHWLTLEEDLIAIRPIDLQGQTLRHMHVHDMRLVQITSVFLIPSIVFIAGLIVWWQRRKGEHS